MLFLVFAVKNTQSKILSHGRHQPANGLAESLNQLHSAIQDAGCAWIRMDYAGMTVCWVRGKSATLAPLIFLVSRFQSLLTLVSPLNMLASITITFILELCFVFSFGVFFTFAGSWLDSVVLARHSILHRDMQSNSV